MPIAIIMLVIFVLFLTAKSKDASDRRGVYMSKSVNEKYDPSIKRETRMKREPIRVPSGSEYAEVYVYDGRPLNGTKYGELFPLTIQVRTRSMQSVYTGTKWTDGYTIAKDHYLIGFLGGDLQCYYLRKMVDKHRYIEVSAIIVGADPAGWPIVKLSVPPREWFDYALSKSTKQLARLASEDLAKQRDALLWQLKAICNEKGRLEYLTQMSKRLEGSEQ